jgi:hypothetical protein
MPDGVRQQTTTETAASSQRPLHREDRHEKRPNQRRRKNQHKTWRRSGEEGTLIQQKREIGQMDTNMVRDLQNLSRRTFSPCASPLDGVSDSESSFVRRCRDQGRRRRHRAGKNSAANHLQLQKQGAIKIRLTKDS